MFFLAYMLSELRRRSGRTILTALGLGLGVGLVVTVNALSTGLDDAQARILAPLTGVGTDMSVTRPIDLSPAQGGGFPQLSDEERQQLQNENGGGRFGLRNLGKPGDSFSRDDFVSTAQLSFASSKVNRIAAIDGVAAVAGGLTLNSIHIEGTVPEESAPRGGFAQPGVGGPPDNIDATSLSVSGVDEKVKALGAITPGQVTTGRYFRFGDGREAILNESYASRENLGVGDEVTLGGKTFTVVGIAETPLGGQSSDVYVKLAQLQKLSDRVGRVNTVYVRAASGDDVAAVASSDREDGRRSLRDDGRGPRRPRVRNARRCEEPRRLARQGADDRRRYSSAFLIASLLTLSSVTKRVRELGTLKALGWSQGLVVRQVTGESLLQGLLGGAVGVVLGLVGRP